MQFRHGGENPPPLQRSIYGFDVGDLNIIQAYSAGWPAVQINLGAWNQQRSLGKFLPTCKLFQAGHVNLSMGECVPVEH